MCQCPHLLISFRPILRESIRSLRIQAKSPIMQDLIFASNRSLISDPVGGDKFIHVVIQVWSLKRICKHAHRLYLSWHRRLMAYFTKEQKITKDTPLTTVTHKRYTSCTNRRFYEEQTEETSACKWSEIEDAVSEKKDCSRQKICSANSQHHKTTL